MAILAAACLTPTDEAPSMAAHCLVSTDAARSNAAGCTPTEIPADVPDDANHNPADTRAAASLPFYTARVIARAACFASAPTQDVRSRSIRRFR